jgi:hypothetical protein
MKPTQFAALTVITVLAVVIAIATYAAQNRWSQPKVSGAGLLPGLAAQAERIAKVEIRQGEKAMTLARGKDGWTLADRGGYPAKAESVRALLVKLAQAELIEPKTRLPERHGLLDLEDPAGKDAKSRLLRVLDDKGGAIAEVVIGKRRYDAFGSSKGGTYVRRPGDVQTWLSNADLDAPLAVRDWVAQAGLFDLAAAKVAKVTVEIAGEEPLVIERDAADAAKHKLVGLPEGKKLKEGAGIDAIVRAAASIDLDDVRKAADPPPAGETSTVKVEGDGGLDVTVKLRKEGADYWVALEAAGTEGDAKKTAEEIAARTKGWEFKVPASKAQSILKRRADLFEAT